MGKRHEAKKVWRWCESVWEEYHLRSTPASDTIIFDSFSAFAEDNRPHGSIIDFSSPASTLRGQPRLRLCRWYSGTTMFWYEIQLHVDRSEPPLTAPYMDYVYVDVTEQIKVPANDLPTRRVTHAPREPGKPRTRANLPLDMNRHELRHLLEDLDKTLRSCEVIVPSPRVRQP